MFKILILISVSLLSIGSCYAKCSENFTENIVNISVDKTPIECNVTASDTGNTLNPFWESTGFCPPDPHDKSSDYMLSEDMHQNLALIGSLPQQAIKQVRIHFLLKLISVKQNVDIGSLNTAYNFTLLDKLLKLLKSYDLKPGFEIMGNPSNIFNDFENKTQLYQWKDLVKEIATHYMKMFGDKYLYEWNFESWNEPSIMFRNHFYDKIKVTPKGFLNYYDASAQGLREVDDNLIFGGPGDHWPQNTKSGPYVIDLMKHYSNGTNYFTGKKGDIKLDFISLHEKGNKGDSNFTDNQELKALNDIEKEFPSLKGKPFVENEGDPETGWDKSRLWRADNTYAATVVKVIARHIRNFNLTNKLSLFGFDHGFLSFYPFQFTQRTLLARFQINNTVPHYTQFIRKPGFTVMGLVSKLGNKLLNFQTNKSINSTFDMIATSFHINNSQESDDFSFLFVNSLDTVSGNGSTQIIFRLNVNQTEIKTNDWKWAQYSLNNTHTNPFKIWHQNNCPDYPSDQLFSQMREQEEPFIEVLPKPFISVNNSWVHSFNIGFPAVSLIQICSKTIDLPKKIERLNGIKVNKDSVLLTWRSSEIRCLKTYQIEYSNHSSGPFELLNKKDTIFPSFQYSVYSKNETIVGFYRVRAIDFWDRKSQFSQVFEWK